MAQDEVQKMLGMKTYKIPVSQSSRSVNAISGVPAAWRVGARGDSEVEDDDDDENDDDTDEEEEETPAQVECSDNEESLEEEESSDGTEEGPAAPDPEKSAEPEADQTQTKISFGGTMHNSDYVPTKDSKDSFRQGTDRAARVKRWNSLDPKAKDPPETQGTEVVTDSSGRVSVAVFEGGRKGFVKKKRL
jgi:hypothetical protein